MTDDEKKQILNIFQKNFYIYGEITINDDGCISVDGDCSTVRTFDKFPVKFNTIVGDFDCNNSILKSLEGGPKIVHGSYHCSSNFIKTLQGFPKFVGKYCTCTDNELKSLEGLPEQLDCDFDCSKNHIETLYGAPKIINGDFDCSYNRLTSLEYSPQFVNGNYDCSYNMLTSLEYSSQFVNGDFNCSYNTITSLNGIPKVVKGSIIISSYHDLPLLKLLTVSDVKYIDILNSVYLTELFTKALKIKNISNRVMKVAFELMRSGYKSNAKL